MRIETPDLAVLALARFSPALDTDAPPVITVDAQSLDDALAQLAPSLDIPVDTSLHPDGTFNVTVTAMAGFRPRSLAGGTPYLKTVRQARDYVASGGDPADLRAKFPTVAGLVTIPSPADQSGGAAKESAIDDILSMVDSGSDSGGTIPSGSVPAQLDALADRLTAAILADPDFRTMEAAWRGAQRLCRQLPSGSPSGLQLTLVPLPQSDPAPVLDRLEAALADTPPDVVVLDHALRNTAAHMGLLERLMAFGEAMLAPCFVQAGPGFLELSDWSDLSRAGFVPGKLEGAEYGRWKTLRERSGAGWVTVCVGDMLARPSHTEPAEADLLWTGAPWAMACLCARSVAVHGRTTRMADRGTVRIDELDLTRGSDPAPLTPMLDSEHRADFKAAGLQPLAAAPGRDQAFLTSAVTMDGGPLVFRLFLSQLTGFLVRMAAHRRDEIAAVETDLAKAITLFIQSLGLPDPGEVRVSAHDEQDGMIPLEITLTPDKEILPGGQPFTFGFGW